MDVQNKGGKGNPHHAKDGKFTSATDSSIPFLNDEATKSSSYSKKKYLEGKTWEELAHCFTDRNTIENKQNEYIDVYFVSPLIKNLFYKPLKKFGLINVFDPADYDRYFDKAGVDTIAENSFGKQYSIDWKCLTSNFGKTTDTLNPEFNIILFRYDPMKKKEVNGYIFKDNLTHSLGFVAIDTPYNRKQIFDLKNKEDTNNINSASLFLTKKQKLKDYLTNNIMPQAEFWNIYQELKRACILYREKRLETTVKDKDNNEFVVFVSKDDNTNGYTCNIKLKGNVLRKYCHAKTLFARKR